jgi:metal transporter CNNM
MNTRATSSYLAQRPLVLGLAKVLFLSVGQIPLVQAAPLLARELFSATDEMEPKDPDDPELWINLTIAAVLVLLGGAFAGLTIALMGQVREHVAGSVHRHKLTWKRRMRFISR